MFWQIMRTCWPGIFKTGIPKFKKEYRYMSGSCRKPSLSRIEPYNEPYSKCLEFTKPEPRRSLFKFYKRPPVKEKPTNCEKIEPKKETSFWKRIFGINPKKSCPPSCICLTIYRKQMLLRQQDPRLLDPRYQLTPGDVLIYTEIIKTREIENPEPQPRTTPLYPVPRAALSKIIIEDIEKKLCKCIAVSPQNQSNYMNIICGTSSIPFKEMKPSIKMKKPFTCKNGIRIEDVIHPSETVINPSRIQDT